MTHRMDCPDNLPFSIFDSVVCFVHLFVTCLTFLFKLKPFLIPWKNPRLLQFLKRGKRIKSQIIGLLSLLNAVNNICEKIIAVRMKDCLDKYNILYDFPFGFRAKHSTSLALVEVIDSCYKKLEGYLVAGVFFDLQKAFDSVNHSILIDKLSCYGFRGKLLDWLTSFLNIRRQFTVLNNVKPYLCLTQIRHKSGLRGPFSDLSCSIFKLMIYLMLFQMKKICLFADDTNLFAFVKDISSLEANINDWIPKLEQWFSSNLLTVNDAKKYHSLFNSNSSVTSPNISLLLENVPISRVFNCVYLGFNIDERLKWVFHIDDVHSGLVKFTSIFFKLHRILPPRVLKDLYFVLIHSQAQESKSREHSKKFLCYT